jgi:malonyl-CoA O-methyltransferase
VSDSASREFIGQASLARRAPRALWRRLAASWRRLTNLQRRPPAEAAFDWLIRFLAPAQRGACACSAVVGQAAAAAAELGELEIATAWSRGLLRMQLPPGSGENSGSLPDGQGCPSRFHTSQALRGFVALEAAWADRARWDSAALGQADVDAMRAALLGAIAAAGAFLARQLDTSGLPVRSGSPPGSIDRWGPASLSLAWLPPLLRAARLLHERPWEQLARRSLRRQLNAVDASCWKAPTHWWAYGLEALADLDEHALARTALARAAAVQTPGGDVPALPGQRWCSGSGLALLATVWYKLGLPEECRRADRALDALARHQLPSGGFAGSWGPAARNVLQAECPQTAALFLAALHRQARRSFESAEGDFPAQIDAGDGRLAAVLDWCAHLGPAPRIIDIGCGKGRFLRRIQSQLPQATLVGVDLSSRALARLPDGVTGRRGDLLNIPAATGEFDAAMCIEALEHSLLPRRAIAEICRIVRPGGRILIIDKDAARQALSDHQPWERWFRPQEVAHWLSSGCREVQWTAIAHGPHNARGLFFCCTAQRHRGQGHASEFRPAGLAVEFIDRTVR